MNFFCFDYDYKLTHTLLLSADAIARAIEEAKKVTDKPSIIKIRTTIGKGSKLEGTEKVHGAPLGPEDIASVKKAFGLDPEKTFFVPDEVYGQYASIRRRGIQQESQWQQMFNNYASQYPQLAAEIKRRFSGELPKDVVAALPKYTPQDTPAATRKLSEMLLNKLAPVLPELVGGSADLTHSNLTKWKGSVDFQAPSSKLGDYSGRYFRFGVREHGMAAICNGIAAYGGFIPFGATFLNFIG